MKKLIIFIAIFYASSFPQQKTLTLEESVDLGLKHSKNARIFYAKYLTAEAKSDEIGSQFFPQLKFNASYARLSDVPPFQVQTPIFPNPITIQEPILNNYSLRLSLHQPIFTGLKLSSLKSAAEFSSVAAKMDYNSELNNEAFEIITAFMSIYKSERTIDLLKKNLKSLSAHLEDTQNFLENNLVTINDYLKIKVEHSSAKLKLIEAENSYKILCSKFSKMLDLPLRTEIHLKIEEVPVFEKILPNSLEEYLSEAKNNRNDLRSLDQRIKAAEENITSASSTWFPSIALFSEYAYANPNQRYLPPKSEFNDSWSLGVNLNWDIWNWGLTSSQTEQAEQNLIQIETTRQKFEDAVEIEVYNNYLNVLSAQERIEVSRESVEQAAENLRTLTEKYKSQLATSADLLDGENILLKGETDFLNAEIDYEIARIKLEKSAGRKIY